MSSSEKDDWYADESDKSESENDDRIYPKWYAGEEEEEIDMPNLQGKH